MQHRNPQWFGLTMVLLAAFAGSRGQALDFTAAENYSNQHGGRALLIWHDGALRKETYARGGGRDRPENQFSITKTLASLAVLSAASQGRLRLDERASDTLTEWRPDPRKRTITIRELLTQTSGLAPGYVEIYGRGGRDKNRATLPLPAGRKFFAYGPSSYEALVILLERKLGRDPVQNLQNGLLRQLGIPRRPWRRDGKGHPYFSAGAYLTPREALRVAHLVRRRGWKGIFPLIPGKQIDAAIQGTAENPLYGMGIWRNQGTSTRHPLKPRDIEEALAAGLGPSEWAASCLSPHAPADLLVMAGSGGQRIYISRSRRLIVVRFGQKSGFRDPDFLEALFGNEKKP